MWPCSRDFPSWLPPGLVVAHEPLPRVLGSDDGPPLGSAVALRGAELLFITPSLLAPRLKLQPETNILAHPK